MDSFKYKAVIFDFDFTLVDALPGIVLSYNNAFRDFGYPERDDQSIRETVGLTVEDSVIILTGCPREAASPIAARFSEHANKFMTPNTSFLPGAGEFLTALKKDNIATGVVTTKRGYRIREFFDMVSAPELLDLVIGFGDVENAKPAPDGLLAACDKLKGQFGIEKEDVLYIGDNLVDSQAADAAGIDFCAVLTGTTPRSSFEALPSIGIFDNMEKLAAYFGKNL